MRGPRRIIIRILVYLSVTTLLVLPFLFNKWRWTSVLAFGIIMLLVLYSTTSMMYRAKVESALPEELRPPDRSEFVERKEDSDGSNNQE